MNLSNKQREVLRDLAGRSIRRSCTNPTLCALERHGLADLEFVPSEHVPSVNVEKWTITDKGREALN